MMWITDARRRPSRIDRSALPHRSKRPQCSASKYHWVSGGGRGARRPPGRELLLRCHRDVRFVRRGHRGLATRRGTVSLVRLVLMSPVTQSSSHVADPLRQAPDDAAVELADEDSEPVFGRSARLVWRTQRSRTSSPGSHARRSRAPASTSAQLLDGVLEPDEALKSRRARVSDQIRCSARRRGSSCARKSWREEPEPLSRRLCTASSSSTTRPGTGR